MVKTSDVAVIGLGAMGSSLVRVLLAKGFRVSVWNRSPRKVESLIDAGALACESAAMAIRSSPVSIMCVSDYAAADLILEEPAVRAALNGRVFVQLSSGRPEQVVAQRDRLVTQGAKYVVGGIMAHASRVGREDCMVLYAGDSVAYSQHKELLLALGPASHYLGDDPVRAIGAYLALGALMTASLCSFFETAAVASKFGIPVRQYAAMSIQTVKESFPGYEDGVERIESDSFDDTLATVGGYLWAMRDAEETFRSNGVQPRITRALIEHLQIAEDLGLAESDLAAVTRAINH
ncbi:NAD(P)-dependent oxidoreductase [Paraburkholderia tropica]|uniref:NAD(P)-dependent oxidoreductase n=1 Tax=Paraburkholderia tropica TaxID=92647 RepID=UPI0015925C89|nr:NAD(P)-binding domain-containing protein [Paraburkholderia tropica]